MDTRTDSHPQWLLDEIEKIWKDHNGEIPRPTIMRIYMLGYRTGAQAVAGN